MTKYFLFLLALISFPAHAIVTHVWENEQVLVNLTNEACSAPTIVASLPAEVVAQSSRYFVVIKKSEDQKAVGKKQVEGCYIVEEPYLFWISELGVTGVNKFSDFRKLKMESI